MANESPDLLPGTLDLLILRIVAGGSMHGYGIAQRLKLLSQDVLQVGESSLYPALQRLLLNGWATDHHTLDLLLQTAGTLAIVWGLLLSVRDQGIGLTATALERIFEPFGRAENAVERNIEGLGLGLYICRRIAEQHGGRLWAESPGDGQGTSMHLWLPGEGK